MSYNDGAERAAGKLLLGHRQSWHVIAVWVLIVLCFGCDENVLRIIALLNLHQTVVIRSRTLPVRPNRASQVTAWVCVIHVIEP